VIRVALLVAVLIGAVLALALPVRAAAQCASRDFVLTQLAERYGESRQGAGLAANGALVEVFASASGTWTMIVTTADQRTCLVASGQGWEAHADPPAPLGVPG
jgi:hypothetical protein